MNARTLSCRSFKSQEAAVLEVRRLSQRGTTVQIADVNLLEPIDVLDLVDLFLHDPAVKGAIEPFASLLSAVVKRRPITIWELLPGVIASESEAFIWHLPQRYPECLPCSSFPMCMGYGVWAQSCETWKAVIGRISIAARELRLMPRSVGISGADAPG
jgi:hypothetical protein